MATSSRQTAIFGVNDWKAIYQTFSQADFKSYDFETIRKSFVDYLRTYYPETFNDYVESSEYIALLDLIAFMGQSLAFRDDLNTRENFIDTAERRDSVIKLTNLISYNPKRNLAGQGYLKISSVQTTEQVKDINGLNCLYKGWGKSDEYLKIRLEVKKYNLNAKIKTGNIKKLKCVVGSGKPCIVLIRSGEWNWHYVIVIGYDKEMIYYANPTDAEIDALSVDEFDRAWNWTSDIRGRSCSWWISFWLRILEIYPRTYVYVDSNI